MSKILLRSLSQEREIVIPDGKTTIGRGPFLTVSIKSTLAVTVVLSYYSVTVKIEPERTYLIDLN